jgi:predicted nucleotidyltransferase
MYGANMKTGPDLNTFVSILRQILPFIAERYQVESLGVFGSYVRNVQRVDSDLDLLVTFRRTPSLLQLVELENYLSDLLGVRVDLVMKDSLKRRIGKRILEEVMPL